jgi:hypothetical protein
MVASRAVTALFVIVAALLMGCGDDGNSKDPLAFFDTPTVIIPSDLKNDRVMRSEVRNGTDKEVRVVADDFKVYDDRGRRLKAAVTFAPGYIHSLYPPTRGPASLPDYELERLGKIAKIAPGKTATLTVSWTEPKGRHTAARIDYGQGSLTIPPESVKQAEKEL